MHADRPGQVTRILQSGLDDERSVEALLPLVYAELRQLAGAWLRKTPPGNTLQATALVHEAFVRLVRVPDLRWHNRRHFFFAAARAMRDILVEQARHKATKKAGGGRRRVRLESLVLAIDTPADEMLALDEALEQLKREDERCYRLVMLRFFAGLTADQAASALGVATRTVERDWKLARARLHRLLTDGT